LYLIVKQINATRTNNKLVIVSAFGLLLSLLLMEAVRKACGSHVAPGK
jgi:hypothetical protein